LQHHQAGRLAEAEAEYRQVLSAQPQHASAMHHLGVIAHQVGRHELAIELIDRALQLQPALPEAHVHLGNAQASLGRLDEAIVSHRQALQLRPASAEAWNSLGSVLAGSNQLTDAEAAFRQAIHLRPAFAEAFSNLGNALKEQGELDEAVAAFREAARLDPSRPALQSNLLYALLFRPFSDAATIATEQQTWNHRFALPLKPLLRPHFNDHDPERRLRVGYVSPNFCRHAISHFLIPLLEAHDRTRVEIYGYASVKRPDDFTRRAHQATDVWRDVLGLDDEALAGRIRADRIDILVDLSQHMAANRLPAFARKPAPVQVAWLGYPASTGLDAIDYRLTDTWMEPDDAPWAESIEEAIRLPDCWFCFDPLEELEPALRLDLRSEPLTFGSLNNFCKVNETTLRLWAAVLRAVEGSRLLLHCPAGNAQGRIGHWFEAQGITPRRLEFVPRTATRAEYLRLWERIDIGLDPFPYNGGTTTCEALWMGTPVVSLAGPSAISRLGLSILNNVGLPELAAASGDDYVHIAAQLAGDIPRRSALRSTLRTRLQNSPLMDARRFARNVEDAYGAMWRRWCAENPDSLP
jgi:predicted O-linked N-acetylglucosamine transferase (SPINDLY family)